MINECETPSCIESAARILHNLDKATDPCEDFYEFACGNYVRNANLAEDESPVSTSSDLEHLVENQLRTIFEEPPTGNQKKPFLMVKNFYNSCTNKSVIEADGLQTFKSLFKGLGGWPTLDGVNWNQNNFEWKESIFNFRNFGLKTSYFLKISVEPDFNDTSQYVIYLDEAELGIDRDYLLSDLGQEHSKTEYEYMVDLALIFGSNRPVAEYDVGNVLNFRAELAKIGLSQEEKQNKSVLYFATTINEMQQKYPRIQWLEFLNKAIANSKGLLNGSQKIIVSNLRYITDVEDLLVRTSRRTQANYLIYQVLTELETYLPESARIYLRQQPIKEPRWRECVKITSKLLDVATSALYAKKHVNKEMKKDVMKLVEDIKLEFIKLIEQAKWLNETTKMIVVEKAKTLQVHAGFSEEILNDQQLNNYYSDLWVTPENLLQSKINISLFKKDKEVALLKEPDNKGELSIHTSPTNMQVFYSDSTNSLYLPAPLLQDSFFNKNQLYSLNYGNLGYSIGRELINGFVSKEKVFNISSKNWWKTNNNPALNEIVKCYLDQYAKYINPETGLHINSSRTLPENIADSSGIKLAYLAYNSWVERNGSELKLPGLKYTPRQLFWISAASNYCTKYKNSTLELSDSLGKYSPNRFRVIGPLSNSEQFSEDFRCSSSAKMNSKVKCQI